MRINGFHHRGSEQESIVAYFIFLLVIAMAVASVGAFVVQTLNVTRRHNEMVEAQTLAEGGVTLAAAELDMTFTNSGALAENLGMNPAGAYLKNLTLSSTRSNVYERTITSPFSRGSVTAQIWTTNVAAPLAARIVGIARVGKVTQSTSLDLQLGFAYGAAVVSDNYGNSSQGVSKQSAQQGNVDFKGSAQPSKNFAFVLDGGAAYAVRANGNVHIGNNVTQPSGAISMANANTANEIPDYTAEGSADQLFDFKRFIAVADLTPSGPSPSANNHFTNMTDFRASLKTNSAANPYQGVIVVDVKKYYGNDKKGKPVDSGDLAALTAQDYPNGINVRGTLVFNFAADAAADDTIIVTAPMNINAADLSAVNLSNPSTYTSGYPATYSDPAKNPLNIDIVSKGFPNFTARDDLPALIYNNAILNLGGSVNISGVVYTPNFIDIENREDGQIQYFKGSLISGGGVYVENLKNSGTVVSYDANTLDVLATSGNKGKRLLATYWQ